MRGSFIKDIFPPLPTINRDERLYSSLRTDKSHYIGDEEGDYWGEDAHPKNIKFHTRCVVSQVRGRFGKQKKTRLQSQTNNLNPKWQIYKGFMATDTLRDTKRSQ